MDFCCKSWVLRTRTVTIKDHQSGQIREVSFDYKTEGAIITGIAISPDGLIIGGSMFPMFYFQYNPKNGQWTRYNSYGQYNTFAVQDESIFIGSYPKGKLLKWNTNRKRVPIQNENKESNPKQLAGIYPYIKRPLDLLVYPGKKIVIMGGRPSRARFGGGLLIWNREKHSSKILKHVDTLFSQSTKSLVALPNSRFLGGTTIEPGDHTQIPKAKRAVPYIMNLNNHKLTWKGSVIHKARSYPDLCVAPNGLVMGIANKNIFFVFDPKTHNVLHRVNLHKTFGSHIPFMQGQRSFIKSPDGDIYLLLEKGILEINPNNFKLTLVAKSPTKITAGGAYYNGRIYFAGEDRTRIFSYDIARGYNEN